MEQTLEKINSGVDTVSDNSIASPFVNEIFDAKNTPAQIANTVSDTVSSPLFNSKTYLETVSTPTIKYKIQYGSSRIFQGLFYPLFYIIYNACFSLSFKGKENLQNIKGPIIFIANHIDFYDSFLFDLFVPPFSELPPFRFMGTTKFEKKMWPMKILKYTGIVDLIYIVFGVFKVTYGGGAEKALIPAYEIIKNKGTVSIFPEGKIWRAKTDEHGNHQPIGPFKWGAAILAKNTGALVVPVSFEKYEKNKFRDGVKIHIGKGYFVNTTDEPEAIAADMRARVLSLFNSN